MTLFLILRVFSLWLLAPSAFGNLSQEITVGGFIDTQYAFDFNSPPDGDRSYTTQPARHNEFNVNLAYLDLKIESARLRSRLALQTGTSVQSNYSAEPQVGNISGSDLSRHIQEARIGYKINDSTWIDGGIFFSHIGAETWISKENLTLTRSLVADYSPYYLSGIKFTHQATEHFTVQLLITNGWQNISENNPDKNIGSLLQYDFDHLTVVYSTMFGKEVSPEINSTPRSSQMRQFHSFVMKSKGTESIEWTTEFDFGFQKRHSLNSASWYGGAAILRYKITPEAKISLRLEKYKDGEQTLIVTSKAEGADFTGGSIGYDQTLEDALIWRTELRHLKATALIFEKNANTWTDQNFTLTTSLALSF